ncbi:hypothetical protein H2202_007712 [Exophiala xenobiotica]|nr:hypothetical protein H2202_007712 [Exophiala xenobiotica]
MTTVPDSSGRSRSETSTAPPPYSDSSDGARDRLPPYRASHTFASGQEELAALREFAESKLYVEPGTNGTLPDIRSGMGMRSLSVGGPMHQDTAYTGLTPETNEERKRRMVEEKTKKKAEHHRKHSISERLTRVIHGGSKDGTSGSTN